MENKFCVFIALLVLTFSPAVKASSKITFSGTQVTFIPNYYSQSNQVYTIPFKDESGQTCASTPKILKFKVPENSISCLCPAYMCGKSYAYNYSSTVIPFINVIDKDHMTVFTKNYCYWGYSLSPSGLYPIEYEAECEKEEKKEPLIEVPNDLDLAKQRFKTLWIEPGVDNHKYSDKSEVYDYFSKLKKLGFERIVIAYSFGDWDHCYYYQPKNTLKFNAYYVDSETKTLTTTLVDAANPGGVCAGYDSKKNLLSYAFSAAESLGLKLMIGLSRTGDVTLLNDIYLANNGMKSTMTLQSDVNARLSYAVSFSNAMASDIWSQFSSYKSFEGWYLTHETHCLDVGSRYYRPVATHLKKISGKLVMISPTIDSQVCKNNGALSDTIDFLSSNKDIIDVYSYQDTLGAGTLWTNGGTKYLYSDLARGQRLYELHIGSSGVPFSGLLASLHYAHKVTNTNYQINVEGWRMNGPSYGNAYGGSWSSIQKQLAIYSLYTDNLMLNEGFLLFNFNHSNLRFEPWDPRDSASKQFTLDYIQYLRKN